MKRVITGIVAGMIVMSLAAVGFAQDKQPQTKCPVMGNKIRRSIYVDYQGKRVFFCCSACLSSWVGNPAKYMKKLVEQGVQLEPVPQEKCPIMGGNINRKLFVDYKGHRVYFCCESCPAKFREDPEKYMKRLDAMAHKKGKYRNPEQWQW
ncbi:MAG: YHS domain-containing protein [Planctomycetes bacterium]|nr:YHS domain-containing protein [Planctomycetota bacterium]